MAGLIILFYKLSGKRLKYHNALGGVKFRKNDYEGAIAEFSAALEIEPDNLQAMYLRGCSYAEYGRHSEAVRDFNSVIDKSPYFMGVLFERGRAKFNLGVYRGALDDIERGLSVNPTNRFGLMLRVKVKEKLGENA